MLCIHTLAVGLHFEGGSPAFVTNLQTNTMGVLVGFVHRESEGGVGGGSDMVAGGWHACTTTENTQEF